MSDSVRKSPPVVPSLFNIEAETYELWKGRPAEPLTQEKIMAALDKLIDQEAERRRWEIANGRN